MYPLESCAPKEQSTASVQAKPATVDVMPSETVVAPTRKPDNG